MNKVVENILVDIDERLSRLEECNNNNRKLLLMFAREIHNLSRLLKDVLISLDDFGEITEDTLPEGLFDAVGGGDTIEDMLITLNGGELELQEFEKELEKYKEQLSPDGQLGIS
tara:strand:+ start:309 stop:650 length:342 start_codon:yes stop_codon:yes gene_type:complete